jgi:hypothetical protein
MKESGEQCTVVFASIVMEYGLRNRHTHSVAGSVIIYAKTTVHCSPGFSTATTQNILYIFFPVVRIGFPHPLTRKGVLLLPPLVPRQETHSLAGEGLGGSNCDDWKDTLVLYVLYTIIPLRALAQFCMNLPLQRRDKLEQQPVPRHSSERDRSRKAPTAVFKSGTAKNCGSGLKNRKLNSEIHPTVPEFMDPVFAKTRPKRSFSIIQNERLGLVFAKTGSINSGTGLVTSLWCVANYQIRNTLKDVGGIAKNHPQTSAYTVRRLAGANSGVGGYGEG